MNIKKFEIEVGESLFKVSSKVKNHLDITVLNKDKRIDITLTIFDLGEAVGIIKMANNAKPGFIDESHLKTLKIVKTENHVKMLISRDSTAIEVSFTNNEFRLIDIILSSMRTEMEIQLLCEA